MTGQNFSNIRTILVKISCPLMTSLAFIIPKVPNT